MSSGQFNPFGSDMMLAQLMQDMQVRRLIVIFSWRKGLLYNNERKAFDIEVLLAGSLRRIEMVWLRGQTQCHVLKLAVGRVVSISLHFNTTFNSSIIP
eukprot:scaffold2248_cov136-Skeletonema_dohrnii-CCMP3373.AAC.17